MNGTVLFVDDDPRILSAMQRVYRREPYEIHTAKSPEEGLSYLRNIQIDLVVVDQNMPGMNGTEFLRIAREIAPGTLRIMLTGEADLSLAIQAINEGEIYRFYTKPYNEIDFGITLRQAIQQKQLLVQARRAVELLNRHNESIEHLELLHPGISQVEKDDGGRVIVDETKGEFNEILMELESEIDRLEKRRFQINSGGLKD